MASLQEIENAFINAHEAGDKEAASFLASELRSMIATQEAPQPIARPSTQTPNQAPSDVNLDFDATPSLSVEDMRRLKGRQAQRSLDRDIYGLPIVGGLYKGAKDMASGGAQLLARGVDAIAGSDLSSDFDKRIIDDERLYQAANQGNPLQDVARIGMGFLGGTPATTAAGAANIASKYVPEAVQRVATGAAVGAGTSPVLMEKAGDQGEYAAQKALQAGAGLVAGGVLEAASPILRKAVQKFGIKDFPEVSESAEEIIPNSNELKKQASNLYKSYELQQATVNPDSVSEFMYKMIDDFTPPDAIKRKGFEDGSVSKALDKVVDLISAGDMTLEGIDEIDKKLTQMVNNEYTFPKGISPDGLEIQKIQENFRDFVENLSEENISGGKAVFEPLKKAREVWSRAKRLEDIENIIKRSQMFYKQPSTAIKTGLRKLLKDIQGKKKRGYSPEEIKAIKKAGETGVIDDLIETAGSRLLQIGGTLKRGAVGAAAGGVASQVMRQAGVNRQMNKMQDLSDMIATGGARTKTPRASMSTGVIEGTTRGLSQATQSLPENDKNRVTYQPLDADQKMRDYFKKHRAAKKQPSFDNIIENIFEEEGGYVANDAGAGETNFGINKRANPDIDVKNLTKDKAASIYKKRYWDKIKADDLEPAMQVIAMDAAVNQGVGWTRNALKKAKGDIQKFKDLRIQRYKNIANNPSKKKYLKSWLGRVDKSYNEALKYV